MADYAVIFRNCIYELKKRHGLKKRGLIDKLLQHGPDYLKAHSISIVNGARNKHQKIPYAEIGEALRYAAADMANEQLGKIFLKGDV